MTTTEKRRMKPLDDEIERIDAEIARLRARREGIVRAKELLSANSSAPPPQATHRKRSANVKPLILNVMAEAGSHGATSGDVAQIIKEKVPTVAKDTVGSVLSRLKADGALIYDGERYYDVKCAPIQHPFDSMLRVAS